MLLLLEEARVLVLDYIYASLPSPRVAPALERLRDRIRQWIISIEDQLDIYELYLCRKSTSASSYKLLHPQERCYVRVGLTDNEVVDIEKLFELYHR